MSGARPWVWLVAILVAAPLAAAEERPEVPLPSYGNLEQGVREQLVEARQELEALLGGTGVAAGELAEAYGRLGRLYYLYDLTGAAIVCFVNARELAGDDFRWHYYLGAAFGLEGRTEEAAASLERALALEPGDVAALVRLGDARLDLGRPQEAATSYREALARDATLAAAEYGLGRVAYLEGDLEQAADRFEAALSLQPEATSIHHSLGMTYRRLGDLKRARRELALNRGDRVRFPDPLIEGLGALIRSGQAAFSAGVEAMKRDDLEAAVQLFLRALEEKPQDHLIQYNLGVAYLRQGKRARAMTALRAALEIDPEFRNGHFNLGSLLAEEGRFEEAAFHFGRAHEIDPDDGVAHLEWATALSRIGRTGQAVAELEKLLAVEPGNGKALLNLGILQAGLGQRERAVATLRRAVEADAAPPDLALARLRLGNLVEERGDRERAIEHYRAAVELAPANLESRFALAGALGRGGSFAEAADAFSEIVARDPAQLEAHFGRGMALLLGGEDARARRQLEASLAQHPESVPLKHLLSRLLVASADPAVRDGARGLELAGEVFQAAQTLEHAETLAMALAETGRYDEAVSWQTRVVEQAEQAGGPGSAPAARRRLELYRKGEACRAPWITG